jgi:hypothetical protein
MDTSLHEWTEGRGDDMVLLTMIDDATSRVLARFYPADTSEAHMDLLGRWLTKHGRPRALYTDRHGIFGGERLEAATAQADAVPRGGPGLDQDRVGPHVHEDLADPSVALENNAD